MVRYWHGTTSLNILKLFNTVKHSNFLLCSMERMEESRVREQDRMSMRSTNLSGWEGGGKGVPEERMKKGKDTAPKPLEKREHMGQKEGA